jgi:hypothetical protein
VRSESDFEFTMEEHGAPWAPPASPISGGTEMKTEDEILAVVEGNPIAGILLSVVLGGILWGGLLFTASHLL